MALRKENYDAIIGAPFGKLGIKVDGRRLLAIDFLDRRVSGKLPESGFAITVCQELENYFNDHCHRFSLPLASGGTPFQQRVWQALQQIPAGRVQNYGDLARRLKTSARAVGGACRDNPIPIVVPCHRIISKQGIGGYMGQVSGDRIRMKQWLIAHEKGQPG